MRLRAGGRGYMPNKRNYQKELEAVINNIKDRGFPRLLLHSCCAPCSSYCMEYLSEFFDITVFYFNPNIYPVEEYLNRVSEQKRLIEEMSFKRPVSFLAGEYEPERFYEAAKGLENEPEGGARCEKCFILRLEETAALAKKEKFDCFTTTLSISPLKSAEKLNNIGEKLAEKYGVKFLNSDFKKRGGYQRSIELSKEYGLYRQDYCGCVFSRREQQ
ncbi:MAG TPA: epoxyqueuosine reductase QueH [Candidatus Alectryocaccobium stercorigallinarum]|nr:epoxyqueuosine reductase QueH [Candidatus Alectryocaccobium stercorigallinarum]